METKPKNLKKVITTLLGYCRKEMWPLTVAILLAIASAILLIIGPSKIQEITDYIFAGLSSSIDLAAIAQVGVTLLIIFLISAICDFIQHYMMATIAQKISWRMRRDIDQKINRLPLKYFSKNSYGDVMSRITNDVDSVGQGLSDNVAETVAAVTQVLGCLVMMIITDLPLASITIITTAFGLFIMLKILKRSQKYFAARQKSLGALNGYIEETYSGHGVIRVLHAEETSHTKFVKFNQAVRTADFKSQFLSGLMHPVMHFTGNLGYVAVCVVGAILVINGHITFGVVTAFLIYVRLFSQPLSQIAQAVAVLQSVAAATERVFEFLGEEELSNDSDKLASLDKVSGQVEFKNIEFAYPDNPKAEVIHNFSAIVKPGQKVAIVGPTGAGKTTIVNLLMRFFEASDGEIFIDDVKITDLKRSAVHSLFGMVLQDTWLFEGTVRENLKFNSPDISDEKMIKVCKACGIDELIRNLPKGYDTVLSDRTTLSAGERQLFTIARVMIQDRPMIILDEATSNVDTRTELKINKAMDELMADRTSFVIAHRLSTIKNADLILVLKDGDIIEQGTHTQLLKKGGFYADIYQSQF
ncbi:ABC transporter ATP-binding protein [Candidatus Saccharibacteria bacterium]|nr:ABC transporter ATP-binding protein [Candidatus Saccharibacteria bacterium]